MIFTLFGCAEEKEIAVEDLYGLWEVVYAERNGHPAETVKGAQFDIRESGEMTTDITGKEVVGDFSFEEGRITHHTETEFVYAVMDIQQDTMHFHVEIKGLEFMLELAKQQKE
jgi:hypothetical protein